MQIKTLGNGPDLVLLHGWSMHSGIWQPLLTNLQQQYRLHLVDLPGHGQSDWQPGDLSLPRIIDSLAARFDFPAIWLGWSLGGLLAIAMASRHPERVKKLVLLAATPRFVQAEGWDCAMPAKVFEDFAGRLDTDPPATLQQFLLLQARGAEHSRQTIRHMAVELAEQPAPQPGALQEGLELLLTLDMRAELASIKQPLQLISGSRDGLIPATMQQQLAALLPAAELHLIDGAGHAPFVSHPQQCLQLINAFCHD